MPGLDVIVIALIAENTEEDHKEEKERPHDRFSSLPWGLFSQQWDCALC